MVGNSQSENSTEPTRLQTGDTVQWTHNALLGDATASGTVIATGLEKFGHDDVIQVDCPDDPNDETFIRPKDIVEGSDEGTDADDLIEQMFDEDGFDPLRDHCQECGDELSTIRQNSRWDVCRSCSGHVGA